MAKLHALCERKGVNLSRAWPFVAGADVFIKRPSTKKLGGESNPEDVQKVDVDENGQGGDDAYDMVRYGGMVKAHGLVSTAVAPVDVLGEMDRAGF
jgi:hypothetical protein